MLELGEDHGAVVGFVVELHALDKVLDGSDILVLLDLAEDGQEFVSLDLLLTCGRKNVQIISIELMHDAIKKNIPFFLVPPIFSIWARVGFRLRARRQSPK